jgi:LysR family transcriptional regulator, glycine cleavage system transcriptional activator
VQAEASRNGYVMYLPLGAISVFRAAAWTGSLTKAAAELNVTPSSVSQQIQALEIRLGNRKRRA